MKVETLKFRVEEHYENSPTYLLHASCDTYEKALKKLNSLIPFGNEKSIFLIVRKKTITEYDAIYRDKGEQK